MPRCSGQLASLRWRGGVMNIQEAVISAIGLATFVGLTWFFTSCTNSEFGPNKEIKQQQAMDLKYIRCKELCAGNVRKFQRGICECQ